MSTILVVASTAMLCCVDWMATNSCKELEDPGISHLDTCCGHNSQGWVTSSFADH